MPTRWKVTNEDRRSPQAQGKYRKEYLKDTIVKANKDTLGLMTFETKEQAIGWASRTVIGAKILKVKPIGRGKIPIVLAHKHCFNLFYKHRRKLVTKKIAEVLLRRREGWGHLDHKINGENIILWKVPKGTVCYPAVEVLE